MAKTCCRNGHPGVAGRHEKLRQTFGVRARGRAVELRVEPFRLLVRFPVGRICRLFRYGLHDHEGSRNRLAVRVQRPDGQVVAVRQLDWFEVQWDPERQDVAVDEREGDRGFVRRRVRPDLQAIRANRRRRQREGPVRSGQGPVCRLRQGIRFAQQVEVDGVGARIGPQDDLDTGGGYAALVDQGAGDGERRVGYWLCPKTARGEAGEDEPEEGWRNAEPEPMPGLSHGEVPAAAYGFGGVDGTGCSSMTRPSRCSPGATLMGICRPS